MRIFQELSQSGTVASEFFHAFFKMIFQKSKGGAPLYFVREVILIRLHELQTIVLFFFSSFFSSIKENEA